MDRGAWQLAVHRVAQSQTRLKQLSTHQFTYLLCLYTLPHVWLKINLMWFAIFLI